jgi:hypothetical protein
MFIQVIQGQVSDATAMRDALDRWAADLAPGAHGWLGTTAGVAGDGTFLCVARFESPEAARRNSERPEQGQWWVETAKLFSGEVTFHDCATVYVYLRGGSDEAGFVQIMQARVRDPERLVEVLSREQDRMAGYRPDLIGGTAALHGDGGYTETAYFSSEREAREAERKELPPDLRRVFQDWLNLFDSDLAYHDLRDPWLYSPEWPGDTAGDCQPSRENTVSQSAATGR